MPSIWISQNDGQYATVASPSAAGTILKKASLSLQKILKNEYGETYTDKSKTNSKKALLM